MSEPTPASGNAEKTTAELAREVLRLAGGATPGEVVEKTESSGFKSYHLETCPGDAYNDTLANFYGNKVEADFASAANPFAMSEVCRAYLELLREAK